MLAFRSSCYPCRLLCCFAVHLEGSAQRFLQSVSRRLCERAMPSERAAAAGCIDVPEYVCVFDGPCHIGLEFPICALSPAAWLAAGYHERVSRSALG